MWRWYGCKSPSLGPCSATGGQALTTGTSLSEPASKINKLIARRFVTEVLDGGSQEVALELFLPGAVRHFPFGDIVMGAEREPMLRGGGRSMTTERHHLCGEGDLITIHLTHHVVFEPNARYQTRLGWIDGGGKTVEWSAMALLRFEDNRIAEEWVIRDELYLALQAGVVTTLASA